MRSKNKEEFEKWKRAHVGTWILPSTDEVVKNYEAGRREVVSAEWICEPAGIPQDAQLAGPMILITGAAAVFGSLLSFSPLGAGAVIVATAILAVLAYRAVLKKQAGRLAHAAVFLEDLPGSHQALVSVSYTVKAPPMSEYPYETKWTDIGSMSIDTEGMIFCSHAISFLMAGQDIGRWFDPDRDRSGRYDSPLRVVLPLQARPDHRLEVSILSWQGSTDVQRREFFERLLEFAAARPASTVPHLLPPALGYRMII